jgi:hypothetical protein
MRTVVAHLDLQQQRHEEKHLVHMIVTKIMNGLSPSTNQGQERTNAGPSSRHPMLASIAAKGVQGTEQSAPPLVKTQENMGTDSSHYQARHVAESAIGNRRHRLYSQCEQNSVGIGRARAQGLSPWTTPTHPEAESGLVRPSVLPLL